MELEVWEEGRRSWGKGRQEGAPFSLLTHCGPLKLRLPLLVGRELAGVCSLAEKPFDDKSMLFHFPFTLDLWLPLLLSSLPGEFPGGPKIVSVNLDSSGQRGRGLAQCNPACLWPKWVRA